MSIEQTNVVDAIGLEGKDMVVLTIIDAFEWDKTKKHLLLLQDKINAYLRFIESGEILVSYPESRGKKVMISLMALHSHDKEAAIFLDRTRGTLENAGYGFRFQTKAE